MDFDSDKWVDLGSGHSFMFVGCQEGSEGDYTPAPFVLEGHDRIVGIIENHPSLLTGESCPGGVMFCASKHDQKRKRPIWSVQSLDPLTISPSVLCVKDKGGCGMHGFIRDGRWIGAG
jgi:uncharacterized protein DUF6527